MTAQPQTFDFSYTVHLAVSLPIEWTLLLKQVAAQHYDLVCRNAGKQGVINGLHNTACDGEFPSSFRVTWRDLDLITKVLEQAHYFPESAALAVEIGQWLREAKAKIEVRLSVLQEDPERDVANSREKYDQVPSDHRWRNEPPTAPEVLECPWWWNKPIDSSPRILQLDGISHGDVVDGSPGEKRVAEEWWAPCMDPDDVETLLARKQRDDFLAETLRLKAREEITEALWRGRVRELNARNAELQAARDSINVELQEARAVNAQACPVVEAALAWRDDPCKGLGSHREAALADAVDVLGRRVRDEADNTSDAVDVLGTKQVTPPTL